MAQLIIVTDPDDGDKFKVQVHEDGDGNRAAWLTDAETIGCCECECPAVECPRTTGSDLCTEVTPGPQTVTVTISGVPLICLPLCTDPSPGGVTGGTVLWLAFDINGTFVVDILSPGFPVGATIVGWGFFVDGTTGFPYSVYDDSGCSSGYGGPSMAAYGVSSLLTITWDTGTGSSSFAVNISATFSTRECPPIPPEEPIRFGSSSLTCGAADAAGWGCCEAKTMTLTDFFANSVSVAGGGTITIEPCGSPPTFPTYAPP